MPLDTVTTEPTAFNLTTVDSAIAATPFANHLHHLVSTSSTNDLALKAALTGARTGVWIADHQLAGRGRGTHTWHSPAGSGLYMTALAAPPIPMQSAPALSLRVAIAVQSAIASTYGFRIPTQIDIRWPNDLLLNSRKVGGILIDTASNPATPTAPATLRYAIIGIGINLNHLAFPPDLEPTATSILRELPTLVEPASTPSGIEDAIVPETGREFSPGTNRIETNRALAPETRSLNNPPQAPASSAPSPVQRHAPSPCPREPLAAAILLALDHELRTLASNLTPKTGLDAHSTWITNKRVRVEPRDGAPGYTGTTAGLNPAGFLLVRGDDGQLHTVLSGGLREP